MNVKVKTVCNPFSFFCVVDEDNYYDNKAAKDYSIKNSNSDQIDLSNVSHGQYVAVLWNNKWIRGIVSMESHFLIWLVDLGTYIRPTENTVFVNLPAEYKKLPSKVFEASIHGVTPIGLELDEFYQFKKDTKLSWSVGAVEQTQELVAKASSTYFEPIALLTTKTNDVVLGNLYLQFEGKKPINLIDEMSSSKDYMHAFMERNNEEYIENLSIFYSSRRLHRACLLKPELPTKNLPTMTTETTLAQYNAICEKVNPFCTEEESDPSSVDGSSVTCMQNINDTPINKLNLTPSEIVKYSNEYIIAGGREYNVLTVLMNKARDLYMSESCKDAKSVGRANTRMKL